MFRHLRSLFKSGFEEAGAPIPVATPEYSVSIPGVAEALKEKGNQFFASGDLNAAEKCYREALALFPAYAAALSNLACVLQRSARIDEARSTAQQALRYSPQLAFPHLILGEIALAQGEGSLAIMHLERYAECVPHDANGIMNLARAHFISGDVGGAETILLAAIESDADALGYRLYLGNIYKESARFELAMAQYLACLAKAPDFWQAQFNLGLAHAAQRQWRPAFELLREVARDRDRVECQLALGELLLLHGEFAEGFALMERRFESQDPKYAYLRNATTRFVGKAQWQGEPLNARRLLVWCEQGLGDALMMLRFLPGLCQSGAASVQVHCQPHLVRLMKATGLPAVVQSLAELPDTESFDLYCSMLSLPHLMKVTPRSLPDLSPRLDIPDELSRRWKARTENLAGLKVGLVWSGNPALTKDALRSIPLADFKMLCPQEGVSFISLQKGAAASQIQDGQLEILDWMNDCEDMLDTAALIANLDLVISVDTSVAHLAGVLAKPVWLLNRHESEWRWQMDRDDSPWYPTMRIFRQDAVGDWEGVMQRVRTALEHFRTLVV